MRNITGDLWKPETYQTEQGNSLPYPDAICITTNGFVKANGEAVMGRGCAKQAANRWKKLSHHLGLKLQEYGNVVQSLATVTVTEARTQLVSFPVKPRGATSEQCNVVAHMRNQFPVGKWVPGWACVAELKIIRKSCQQLRAMADAYEWQTVVLPRPGCGAGELEWKDVEPVLQEELDDRFYVITYR